MSEKYLPVTPAVYEAVMELQKRLQNVYGSEVSVSDTIDFLGHQSFVSKRLLDILSLVTIERAEEREGCAGSELFAVASWRPGREAAPGRHLLF
jgi:hypothetical protein